MNTTKALFSELVYDFQSERWNEFELPKLSLRELQALARSCSQPMGWFGTILSAVLIYVAGQVLVRLIEPALTLRTLIGRIAGELLMHANRDPKVASDEERYRLFPFLDVEKFPLITFKNTSAQRVNDRQYTLTGDLTFHGVTKPLTLRSNLVGQSKDSKGESHTGSDIYLVIKRSEFGIKGDSPAVGDDIFLTIRVRN